MGMIIMDAASKGIDRAPGTWFVLANGLATTSSDPTLGSGSWSVIHVPGFTISNQEECVAYGNGYWAVAGDSPSHGTGNGLLSTASNPDFGPWTAQVSNVSRDLYTIAYGNGYWVVGGNIGSIATSTGSPPSVWTLRTPALSANHIYYIRYLNGYWFACCNNGEVYICNSNPASGSWVYNSTIGTIFGTGAVRFASYANGYWVVVGTARKIAVCSDADPVTGTWTEVVTTIGSSSMAFYSIAYANGYWAIVGDSNFAGFPVVFGVATDILGPWTEYATTYTSFLRVIEYHNGIWLRAGNQEIQYAFNPTGTWITTKSSPVNWQYVAWKAP